MIRTKLLSLFSTAQYFRPNFDLNFDAEGRLLLYSTPSATVMFIKTFLKFYVPINAGFILVHTYFSLAEFMFPLIPGKSTYLIMSNCMIAIGIGMAAGTEIFARRFIKNIYLMSDGKTLSVEFHKAFSV